MKASPIETLIKVKKSADSDDLVSLMDEIILYERLSKAEAFRDLGTSRAAQGKLPLLYQAYCGDTYAATLLWVARNIFLHLLPSVPPIVAQILQQAEAGVTAKERRQREILEKSVVEAIYYAISEYDHSETKDSVAAVFTETDAESGRTAIIILAVKKNAAKKKAFYEVYQGYYKKEEKEKEPPKLAVEPCVRMDGGYALSVSAYSVLGNNAYPFAAFTAGQTEYSVRMETHDCVELVPESGPSCTLLLEQGQVNDLNMAKLDHAAFTECLLSVLKTQYKKFMENGGAL